MVKKVTLSQFRQAINKYNSEVKRYNYDLKRKVDNYNREVRKFNAEQNARKQKLKNTINRFNQRSSITVTRTISIRQSTELLNHKYEALESFVDSYYSDNYTNLLIDFPERETSNSVMVYNSLSGINDGEILPNDFLQKTVLENALYSISNEIGKRWDGAIYSLNPKNPDAARHFCTSVREVFSQILDIKAPDLTVARYLPDCQFYNNRPNRRSKIRYILSLKSLTIEPLTDFVNTDIDDLINLFDELNSGTHGNAGKFDIQQLLKLKKRTEDAILYLVNICNN